MVGPEPMLRAKRAKKANNKIPHTPTSFYPIHHEQLGEVFVDLREFRLLVEPLSWGAACLVY